MLTDTVGRDRHAMCINAKANLGGVGGGGRKEKGNGSEQEFQMNEKYPLKEFMSQRE